MLSGGVLLLVGFTSAFGAVEGTGEVENPVYKRGSDDAKFRSNCKKTQQQGTANCFRVETMKNTARTSAQLNSEYRIVEDEMSRKGKLLPQKMREFAIQAEETLDFQKNLGAVEEAV